MNFILNCAHTISKRLETISGRFIFVVLVLLLQYSYGNAGFVLDSMAILDSTENVLLEETAVLDLTDSTDEADTIEPKWSVSAGVNFRNQQQKNGVDLSGGKPVIGSSLDIGHEIGLGLSFNSTHRLENGVKFQDLSYGLSYTYSVAEWMDLSADFTRYKYSSDTVNALAAQTGSVTLTADFYYKKLIIDVSVDRYLGTSDKQTYFSLAGLLLVRYKDLRITPMVSVSAVSYEIDTKRTKIKKNTVQTVTKKALSLSSVMASVSLKYPLVSGISASFTPAIIYSPLDDLASDRLQITATVGVSYSVDF